MRLNKNNQKFLAMSVALAIFVNRTIAGENDIKVGDRMPSLIVGDTTYENIKITSITKENIIIIHKGGATTIHLLSLPQDFRSRIIIPEEDPSVIKAREDAKEFEQKRKEKEVADKQFYADLEKSLMAERELLLKTAREGGALPINNWHRILIGRSALSVREMLGSPKYTLRGDTQWTYFNRVYNPASGTTSHLRVIYGEGAVVESLSGD